MGGGGGLGTSPPYLSCSGITQYNEGISCQDQLSQVHVGNTLT